MLIYPVCPHYISTNDAVYLRLVEAGNNPQMEQSAEYINS